MYYVKNQGSNFGGILDWLFPAKPAAEAVGPIDWTKETLETALPASPVVQEGLDVVAAAAAALAEKKVALAAGGATFGTIVVAGLLIGAGYMLFGKKSKKRGGKRRRR